MDFSNGKELLHCCGKHKLPISGITRLREIEIGHVTEEEIDQRLSKVYDIMSNSIKVPIREPRKSIGGLIGGEGRAMMDHMTDYSGLSGRLLTKSIAYAMAVLEENASMGLIVAAPTAGSSGILPGVLMAFKEENNLGREAFYDGIMNAAAIGFLLTRNASVAGAEAGCQAEVGSASAMAASALVELMGGKPEVSLAAASLALSNLLGLVCDPIAGLVESPCQSRNSIGAANAVICAQMALSGVRHPVPFDEMAEAMFRVGRSIPFALRETAMGGCAATPTGVKLRCRSVTNEKGGVLTPLSK